MVLNLPILADYGCIFIDGLTVYMTHGHKFNAQTPPPLLPGDILLHGHTHIPTCVEFGDRNFCINPGSAAIPKGGYPKSYMIYNDRSFIVKDFDQNVILTKKF
jgi:predicted phosphodiesterase